MFASRLMLGSTCRNRPLCGSLTFELIDRVYIWFAAFSLPRVNWFYILLIFGSIPALVLTSSLGKAARPVSVISIYQRHIPPQHLISENAYDDHGVVGVCFCFFSGFSVSFSVRQRSSQSGATGADSGGLTDEEVGTCRAGISFQDRG